MDLHPLTPQRWNDFEELFGSHGAYGGCWCMWWRTTRKEFEACQGEKNRTALKKLVDGGAVNYVRKQGGNVIKAYPTVPRKRKLPPVSTFMGFPEVFARVGFVECARPSEARMVMRLAIK